MLVAELALPPSRPRPDAGCVQFWPSKCHAPSRWPFAAGAPNTQTLVRLSTRAPPTCLENECTRLQVLPFQRSTRDLAAPAVNAHTSVADDAPAATTRSPGLPGKS